MPWVEQLADPQELRRCIRDLVALSTLPAIWKNYDPHQIADSVTAALLSMLSADFVHIALPGKPDEPRIEVTHVGRKVSRESVGAIQAGCARHRQDGWSTLRSLSTHWETAKCAWQPPR